VKRENIGSKQGKNNLKRGIESKAKTGKYFP
jgi:hypothetical protein